jgi:ribosomal protein L37AE/L43A
VTWVKIVKKREPAHDCVLPDAIEMLTQKVASGSLWRCDTCGQDYRLAGAMVGRYWTRINKAVARRLAAE